MTVKQHIINYMKHLMNSNKATFETSDIQNLSERSTKFVPSGRLGSPGTYERMFRTLRESGMIQVKKYKRFKKQKQSSWYLENIGDENGKNKRT